MTNFFLKLILTKRAVLLHLLIKFVFHIGVLALDCTASLLCHSCLSRCCHGSVIAFIMFFEDNVSHRFVALTPLFILEPHLSVPLLRLSLVYITRLSLTQVYDFKYILSASPSAGWFVEIAPIRFT